MSGGPTQASNTTSEPWANVKEPMIDVVNQAAQYYSEPYHAYTGQTVADPSAGTAAYNNLTMQRAQNGAPDLNAARGMAGSMASGDYLNSNPWLQNDYTNAVIGQNAQNMANAFATGTAAQNDAMFARSGAFGGSAWQQKQQSDAANLTNQVGQMANNYQLQRTQLGANDYNSGLSNMLQAGQLAGSLSQDDWTAANALRTMGTDQQNQQQKVLDAQKGDWSAQMQYPEYALTKMGNLLSLFSGYGTQSTSGNPYAASPVSTAIGAGLLGTGLYNAFK